MPALQVRDVPESVVAALRERAAKRGVSMQQELLRILEDAANLPARDQASPPLRLITVKRGGSEISRKKPSAANRPAAASARTLKHPGFDVAVLGLTPLALHPLGDWDPAEEYWGEEGEPIAEWATPIIAGGKRPMFEMEKVVPGNDFRSFDSDPILAALELRQAGDPRGARARLMKLIQQDQRCLDAHAHLGNLEFDRRPKDALTRYQIGMMIGELSLGDDFIGVLPWGFIDNRPFLRCMHGVGLCAWRLGAVDTAKALFTKMLWLNPGDNQGVRFNLAAIEAGRTWEEAQADER